MHSVNTQKKYILSFKYNIKSFTNSKWCKNIYININV